LEFGLTQDSLLRSYLSFSSMELYKIPVVTITIYTPTPPPIRGLGLKHRPSDTMLDDGALGGKSDDCMVLLA